ncbi:MAG: DNA recombination protein RmuC [Deltaproteobacteria bacterium]|nr:DNA recombination protein RmuC [Deltaproteobacteria bacterium]
MTAFLVLFFIAFAASVIVSLAYIAKLKAYYSDIITRNSLQNDQNIKNNIVLESELNNEKNQHNQTVSRLKDAQTEIDGLRKENTDLIAGLSKVNADNKNLEERILAQKADLDLKLSSQKSEFLELENRFKEAFENLSAKILEDKSKKFTEINKESLDGILKPLSDRIKEFEKKVEDTYVSDTKERYSLQNTISKLIETENNMKLTTENLTKALKGNAKVQGNWGEMVLETLLEYSGLIKGEQYETQKSLSIEDENGFIENLRPDVIVHLPEDRELILDSKVSLTDYEKYVSAEENDENRKDYLKNHVNSIKKHIDELSGKRYNIALGGKSLDFVIMFIPIDFAYTVALNEDKNMLNEALNKNIIIATPSVLLLMLKTVENLWYQVNLNRNAVLIMGEAGKLYDKFISFAESMQEIKTGINKTSLAYDAAINQLSRGKGNLINKLEGIKKLGVKSNKSLPEKIEYDTDDI